MSRLDIDTSQSRAAWWVMKWRGFMVLERFLSDGAGAPSLNQCRIHAGRSTGELDARNQAAGDPPGEVDTYASVSTPPGHSPAEVPRFGSHLRVEANHFSASCSMKICLQLGDGAEGDEFHCWFLPVS